MKRVFIVLLILVLTVSFSLTLISADLSESIKVYKNLVTLEVNGNKIGVDNFAYNGITYIPLRSVSEVLDKNVGWNSYENLASINEKKYEIESLSKLLPDKKGFEWVYDGFAEYGHTMKLDNIVDTKINREYIISGEVDNLTTFDNMWDGLFWDEVYSSNWPFGDESTEARALNIKYTISGNKLIQEKSEEAMLDSNFDKITLIETPLVAGTYWSENIKDQDGKNTTINAFIQKVEVGKDGKKQYTIKYDDANSDYYEIRIIQEGMGVVSFEKLIRLENSSLEVNYFLHSKDAKK